MSLRNQPKRLTKQKYQPKHLAPQQPRAERIRAARARIAKKLKSILPQKHQPKRLMRRAARPRVTMEQRRYNCEIYLASLNWRRIWRLSMAVWALTLLTVVLFKFDFAANQTKNISDEPPMSALTASRIAYAMPMEQLQGQLAEAKHLSDSVQALTISDTAVYSSSAIREEIAEIIAAANANTVSQDVPADEYIDSATEEPAVSEVTAAEVVASEPPEADADVATSDKTYEDYAALFTPAVKNMLCQMLYGEAEGIQSHCELAMHYCVVFNRYDTGRFGSTFAEIITRPQQFVGYHDYNPVTERDMAVLDQVIDQWIRMKLGESLDEVGWPMPTDIMFWHANPSGTHNLFYKYENFNSGNRIYFDYQHPLHNPYGS